MRIRSDDFQDMQPIPFECAFGRPGPAGEPCVLSQNSNPHLAWSEVPASARSFVVTCIDGDAPSVGDDVNREGRHVPASLARTDFVHWLIADIPLACSELAHGACSNGVTARGKRDPAGPAGSCQGRNDYTGWFAGDAQMAGDYLGYDGPCPPWNDERMHRYRFEVCALDVEHLGLAPGFSLAQLRDAMRGHVLAQAVLTGTFTLNPTLRG
jgi:Raf kinase inhibitor-like YbhB/YbcL family protein